jgi:hypothetical protein
MMHCRLAMVMTLACVPLAAAGPVRAKSPFRAAFFNAYPTARGTVLDDLPSNNSHCGVCHYDFTGWGAVNPYGEDVHTAIHSGLHESYEAAIRSVELLDSDGDGYSNLVEITELSTFGNTPTFPGLKSGDEGLLSNVTVAEIVSHLTPAALAVETTTWGRIKALYRD